MTKKSLLLITGIFIFIVGMITFPLPIPIGLPLMIIGMTVIFKASHKAKRRFIKLVKKNTYSKNVWKRTRKLIKTIK